jgi:hypothetical protein
VGAPRTTQTNFEERLFFNEKQRRRHRRQGPRYFLSSSIHHASLFTLDVFEPQVRLATIHCIDS